MYITPRVLIQQEFTQLPVYSEFPLPAFVIGPNYSLFRYSETSERPFTAVGTLDGLVLDSGNNYINNTNTVYDFPNVHAGGNVDHSYTKVFAESVEAQYFPLESLGGVGMGADAVTYVQSAQGATYSNRVRFTNTTLKSANGYTRADVFSNRDVAINDVIEITDGTNSVRAKIKSILAESHLENSDLEATIAETLYSGNDGVTNGSTSFSSSSASFESSVVGKYLTLPGLSSSSGSFKVIGFVNSTTIVLDRAVASNTSLAWQIGGVYGAISNKAKQAQAINGSVVPSTGTSNSTLTVVNGTSVYVGHVAKAILADTYTATVTTAGSTSQVRFSVSSSNGAFITRTGVSLDGNTLVLDDSSGNVVTLEFSEASQGTPIAFALGNSWSLSVAAAVNPITSYDDEIEFGGTYTGKVDMVYTLRVERGGLFYDGSNSATCARFVVTASDVDNSRLILPENGTALKVGSYGVTVTFNTAPSDGGFILGDVYHIPVTAAKLGAFNIVEFSESLPETILANTPELTASLFLTQKSIQIPATRDLLTGTTNWTQEDSYITINSEITTYDNALVSAGEPVRLPIVSAKLFVEHRDLLQDHVNAISSVRSLSDINSLLGTVHPDNPLAQGVYDAVLNAANQVVYFIAVATDDLAGYTEAIKISEKNDKVYSFVPLTFDRTIQDAVVSHVNAYSTPEVGRWRIAWLAVEDKKTAAIYDLKQDGTAYQATITDDPAVSGVQNKLVTIADAKFVEDGIRPNDSIRINFRLNADGDQIYDEYVVDHVRTNTTLILTKGLVVPVGTPTKVQVIRNFTKSERAYNIAHIGGDFNNRRVRCVFPDTFKYGNITKQGYFAAAGLAGLRSGVVPHQGLTNSEYLGADDLSKVVLDFNQDDLNTMAEQGIWLITQEVIGATPYVRHQLTTDTGGLNTSEDSITTNVDNISYALKKTLAPFIGRWNVNSENVAVVRAAIVAELAFRATSTSTVRAGNQLTSFTPKDDILKIEQNATYKDRIDVEVRLHVPYPMNYISLKLIV